MLNFYIDKDNFIPTKMGVLLNLKIFLADVKPKIYLGEEYYAIHTICYDYFDPIGSMGTYEEFYSHVSSKLFSEDSSALTKIAKIAMFKVTMEIEDFYA